MEIDHENQHDTCGLNRLLVRVIQSDPTNGLSEILVGELSNLYGPIRYPQSRR